MTPWTAAHQASLSFTISQSLLKLMSIDAMDSCHWCHLTISSSVAHFSCLQSFSASGLFQWVGSSNQGAKILELWMNIQGLFPLGLTYLISLMSKGLPRVFSNTTIQKPFQRNRNARRHSQSERPGLSRFGWLRASWIERRCNKLHSTICIILLSEFVSRNAWLQHYQ